MRNIRKSSTLESKFPLLAVEQGCIISKDGDITVAYEVTLPEIFTVTSQEYESVHAAWCKAIKVLPDYSIVHKQDWFVKENYSPDLQNSDMSFLSRSYERHFNERPYLHHQCYLFLTKTTKERMAHQSNFSTLCRGHIIPKEIKDKETVARFLDAVEQFARIINDSGYISLRRLTDDEITGTERTTGLEASTSRSPRRTCNVWRIWNCLQMVCVSETNTYAFIPCRKRKTFLRKYLRTTALSDCPLTEVTADFPLPLQLACCCPATISITSMY